jgi:GNAT superfamily N-acetyltransferase
MLRIATSADVPKLRDLISRSVRALSVDLYTPVQIERALTFVLGVDTQLITDGTYFLIEEDGQPVAAGGWSARQTLYGCDQSKGVADPLLDPSTSPARIRAFFVDPAWARRGLARQLFIACETAARAHGFRGFELVATLPGVPLYRALGFVERDPVNVDLGDGLILPCLRMDRPIATE